MADAAPRSANRNTELGDRACFCGSCGWARRYYPGVVEPPSECPTCAAAIVVACPACAADILSVMAVECDQCGEALREPEANGVRIHRPKRLPMARATQQPREGGGAGTGVGSCAT